MTVRNCIAGVDDTPVVAILDDDASSRDSLKSLIHSMGWTARVFTSATAFLACPRMSAPSCLILNVRLPDLCGLELQLRIADRSEMPVIFLTKDGDVQTTVRAMKAGAFEFMTKPFDKDAMLSAISSAIGLSRVVLSQSAERLLLHQRYTLLSHRERQVMALVVQGLLNKLIAAELGISEITVKAHRGKMMRKMKTRSLPELVRIAGRISPLTSPGIDNPRSLACARYAAPLHMQQVGGRADPLVSAA